MESKKLVVAYIGFGNSVCRYHLPYVRIRKEKIKVKYIYRRTEDRIDDMDREKWYPDINFTSNLDDVLNDTDVNLVVVNTPDKYHVYYIKEAIKHRKNVLCEKPFALSVEEAKEVFEYAKKNNVIVMSNQNRRFDADMITVRKVIESGVLGEILEVESHYDYYRPNICEHKGFGFLYGLAVHPIDQIVGQFGKPSKITFDCRSIDNPGISDDYYDIELYYGKMKAIVKTSFYVKLDYPRFIVHGRNGSFLIPQLGHQSAQEKKPGPVEISFDPLPEKYWGTLSYYDQNNVEVNKKIPVEVQDYGLIYDNLYDVIFNNGVKIVKDEEVITVLDIIGQATEVAKGAR